MTAHPASPTHCPEDDGLRTAALARPRSSGSGVLLRLRCEVTDAVVIVHGALPSYYLKQMAQAVIPRLDGTRSVTNLVGVRGKGGFQPGGEGEAIGPFTRGQCDGA
jgi:hypothetical protein